MIAKATLLLVEGFTTKLPFVILCERGKVSIVCPCLSILYINYHYMFGDIKIHNRYM